MSELSGADLVPDICVCFALASRLNLRPTTRNNARGGDLYTSNAARDSNRDEEPKDSILQRV